MTAILIDAHGGETEVSEVHLEVVVNEQVLELDVPMNDSQSVHALQDYMTWNWVIIPPRIWMKMYLHTSSLNAPSPPSMYWNKSPYW
jgi:hypothetical protein